MTVRVLVVDDEGNLGTISDKMSASLPEFVIFIEALLIEAVEPSQNRKGGDNFSAVEYLQQEDPALEIDRRKLYVKEMTERMLGS